MMGLGRERRLNCRLYVDRQADATVIEKLDRLLVEKHFQNQTELIKHGIELVYQEVYERENVGSQADISGVDLQKLAEAIADELKPELRQLLENCEERILKEVAAMKLGSGVAVAEISDVPEKKGLSGQAIGFLKSLNNDWATMLDLVSIEDEVRNTVRVLEYPYGDEKEERALDVAEKLEYPVYEVVTEGASEIEEDIVEDVEAAIESEAIAEELVVEGDGLEDATEPIIELQEPMVDVSEALVDVVPNVMEDEVDDVPAIDTEVTVENKEGFVTYDRFKSMTPEEKADTFRFRRMRSFNTVHNLVSLFFYDIDHIADTNEIMEEAQLVYKGKRNNFIKQRIGEMWRQSIPWSFLICVSQIR